MSKIEILKTYIIEALQQKNGSASILEICKYVWQRHQGDLYNQGSLFYTWQYDIRWAATELRQENRLVNRRGYWTLIY
jgi:hypothetical protein